MPKPISEGKFQKQVIDFLDEHDYWHVKYWAGGKYTKSGIPDILACIEGEFWGIELKKESGVPSELQKYNLRKIKSNGGNAIVLRPSNFEDWKQQILG